MPKREPSGITLTDRDGHYLHAVWSRSAKRLIVSVADGPNWDWVGQVQLDRDQVDQLREFVSETVEEPPLLR